MASSPLNLQSLYVNTAHPLQCEVKYPNLKPPSRCNRTENALSCVVKMRKMRFLVLKCGFLSLVSYASVPSSGITLARPHTGGGLISEHHGNSIKRYIASSHQKYATIALLVLNSSTSDTNNLQGCSVLQYELVLTSSTARGSVVQTCGACCTRASRLFPTWTCNARAVKR
eukprot:1155657-Rhodomonas_salina.1